MFFTFPEDTRWNAERQAVELGVEIGGYCGVVRVPRWVFEQPASSAARARAGSITLVVFSSWEAHRNGRLRRVSVVAPNPGECLLSEPTAVTRPRRRILVFMPLNRHQRCDPSND